jgi:hypothetical protein
MYVSLIEDKEMVQGDSSDIYFLGVKDGRSLATNWVCKYTIIEDFGKSPIVQRTLSLNSGLGEGDSYTVGTKFIFQVLPTESALLIPGKKYIISVQMSNPTIPYNSEIAQYRVKIKPQGVL